MNPSRLRKWMQKYGNLGILVVAAYLGMHYLWTKRCLPLILVMLVVGAGCLKLVLHLQPAPASLSNPTMPLEWISPLSLGAVSDEEYRRVNARLLWAVQQNDMEGAKAEIVQYLLRKGAKVNAQNRWGETALDCVQQEGSREMVKLLKQAGAKAGKADR